MKLNELQYTKGSRRKEMRVGRGMGTKGKQCGRGMNGQTKHNVAGPHPGFEGGQLDGVKVLGGSKLTKKLTVRAAKFSASAKQAIEEAGGAIEVIE